MVAQVGQAITHMYAHRSINRAVEKQIHVKFVIIINRSQKFISHDFESTIGNNETSQRNSPSFYCTNTKSLAKEFSKILIFEYFRYLKGFDVFFDAGSESPRMT